MAYSFEQFCGDCRSALKADTGPGGHEEVRRNLEKLLADEAFVAAHCGPDAEAGIRTIYKDEETGFNVLVHVYEAGKTSPPHDHGASWAVYGQAAEYTDMTAWRRLDEGTDDGAAESRAELEKTGTQRLVPGMAGKFEVGNIHSIHFPDGARFVRVTGTDLDAIPTRRYDPDAKSVKFGGRM
jgi:predicted metal-dependent enzyme (double-stranded beta helix superfamily)